MWMFDVHNTSSCSANLSEFLQTRAIQSLIQHFIQLPTHTHVSQGTENTYHRCNYTSNDECRWQNNPPLTWIRPMNRHNSVLVELATGQRAAWWNFLMLSCFSLQIANTYLSDKRTPYSFTFKCRIIASGWTWLWLGLYQNCANACE